MSPSKYQPRRPVHRPGRSFLTVAEVAAELRVSKMSVYRRIHSCELPAVRIGSSFRVTEEALDRYIRDSIASQWTAEE